MHTGSGLCSAQINGVPDAVKKPPSQGFPSKCTAPSKPRFRREMHSSSVVLPDPEGLL